MADPRPCPSSERRSRRLVAVLAACWSLASWAGAGDGPTAPVAVSPIGSREAPMPTLSATEIALSGHRLPQELYLEVFHDDRPTGLIAHFRLRDGRLAATVDELRAIGLVPPDNAPRDGDGMVPLDALPGLAYRYERTAQRLILHAPPALRPIQRLGYRPPDAVEVRRDAGWLLGYDAYGRRLEDEESLGVATSLRRFGRAGTFELTGVSRAGDGEARGYRRLDTRWTYSDPQRLWTWTAGDLISGGLAWTRPVRLGGLQWRRNFGVRPDLVTLPMPRFTADATVPSTVELYVDNVRQFGAEVQDGPFVLDTLPRISGAGQASLVVTDALGRTTQTTVPLYVDHRRLAAGLTDFSVEAGLLRHDFGSEDDDYGRDPVASASLRHGVTDTFTLEGHGEAGSGLRLAGVGAVWSPAGRWGVVSGSYAYGDGETHGDQYTLGYQWNAPRYGFDLSTRRRDPGFRDLGDLDFGDLDLEGAASLPSLRSADRGTFWLPVARGSLAFTWLRWEDDDDGSHRTRSLSWTQNLGSRLSVAATVFDDDDSGRGGGLSMSIPLGRRHHVSTSVRRSRDHTSTAVNLRRSAPYEGGWGWSVQAGDEPDGYGQATAEVRGRQGEARFGVERRGGETSSYFDGGGSVAMMDGQVFLSRRIHDAFAVVSTGGVPDVQVLSENRAYGRTNDKGFLLVPELRGWQRNRLAVDPDDLGADVRVGEVEKLATPADGSGVLVRFDLAEVRPAIVTLLGPQGDPVPAGHRGRLVGTAQEIIVGFDGEAYVDNVTPVTTIELEVEGVLCRYRVPRENPRRDMPQPLQPLRCERMNP